MNKQALKFALAAAFAFLPVAQALYAAQSTIPPVADMTADKKIVVIIDPGHGGGDWGVTLKGIHEKEITLDIAKHIKEKIEKTGRNIAVFLTRTGDEFVKPEDRAGFANGNKGNLFISIHCDYAPSEAAGGYRVFYEDGAQAAGAAADQGLIKWDEAQKYHIDGSRKLSAYILQYLGAALMPENQRSDENDLLPLQSRKDLAIRSSILQSIDMPAIVLETGNLYNNNDLTNLKDSRIVNQLAYHIKEGIINYVKETGGGRQ
jgi:N-acetylmuramoyl-L-alanine amidase